MSSAFHKVVKRKYLSDVAKTTVLCVKFFPDVVCQKSSESANILRSYSKNKSGAFLWTTVYVGKMQNQNKL